VDDRVAVDILHALFIVYFVPNDGDGADVTGRAIVPTVVIVAASSAGSAVIVTAPVPIVAAVAFSIVATATGTAASAVAVGDQAAVRRRPAGHAQGAVRRLTTAAGRSRNGDRSADGDLVVGSGEPSQPQVIRTVIEERRILSGFNQNPEPLRVEGRVVDRGAADDAGCRGSERE